MNSRTSGQFDNFKLITGIGPVIERRLHEAGITSFAQLAALTPEEIADRLQGLTGMSGNRVREQEWVRQAQELAALKPTDATLFQETPGNGQHYATFTVQLLLEEDNEVRRVRVLHVQSQARDTWAGWDGERLVRFLKQQAAIQPPPSEQEKQLVTEGEANLSRESVKGRLQLRELQVVPEARPRAAGVGAHLMQRLEPYGIRLVLDLTDVTGPPEVPLQYSATVYAKRLNNGERQPLGNSQGRVSSSELLEIQFPGQFARFSSGVYRLEAEITLSAPSAYSLVELVPGELVQVP